MTEDPRWPRADAWLRPHGDGTAAPAGPGLLAVLGVPLSATSISPSQAHRTPAAVRAALRRFSPYSGDAGVDLQAVDARDLGDLDIAELPVGEALDRIVAGVHGVPARLGRVPDLLVLLGGDNALTRPALRAVAGERLPRAGLLTLDAHHDLRGFHDGPTNGTPVRGLLDDGLPGGAVVQVGLGAFTNSAAYRGDADAAGITCVSAAAARREGVGPTVRRLLDALAARCDLIYVDLDVDVVDSAFVPGCPGARPGGLLPSDLHAAAFEAGRHPNVIAVDVVEVDAAADERGVTVDVAAQCLLHAAAGLAVRSVTPAADHGPPSGR